MVHLSDPIGDLITRLRNAQSARKTSCMAPHSRIKQELCELLKKEGYVADVRVIGDAPHQELEVVFLEDKPALALKRLSTPGQRRYVGYQDLKPVLSGHGIAVITTSAGLLTDKEARKRKVGGEILCTIS
jgi:small subunit ribosomal protein S8